PRGARRRRSRRAPCRARRAPPRAGSGAGVPGADPDPAPRPRWRARVRARALSKSDGSSLLLPERQLDLVYGSTALVGDRDLLSGPKLGGRLVELPAGAHRLTVDVHDQVVGLDPGERRG